MKKIVDEKMIKKIKKIFDIPINIVIPIILTMLLNFGICGINLPGIGNLASWFSILIMYIIFFIITSLVKKTHITTYILSILICVLSLINNVKMNYTNAPIYLSDVYFLKNIFELTGLVKDNITSYINYYQIILLLCWLFMTCIISRLFSMEIKKMKHRICTITVSILVIILIFAPIKIKNDFALNKMFKIGERKDYKAIVTGKDYYSNYSVLAGMYGMYLEENSILPEGYNKKEIQNYISESVDIIETEETKLNKEKNGKPNIILMFQESYWDIEKIDEIEFDKNITENINNLKKKGTHVSLLSPSYGGLSSNVEFELLTGGNLAYFNAGYNPFMQLYRKEIAANNPSIINDLKNNGYKTKVVFGRDYYLSETTYKRLGMDEYINAIVDKKDYAKYIKGNYISDEALIDDVIDALYNKDKEDRIFYMTATIQSHMPFYAGKYRNYDISVTNSSLSEDERDIILSYAQGVYDTNIQIQRLYEEIQNIDEPTILIVLGDHLPYLNNNAGEDILQKMSYFNTEDEKQNLLRKYTTDALILSNYNANIEINTEYISPDLLITTIVNNLDINISPFFRWLYQTREVLPAQNQYLIVDKDLNIYNKDEMLPDEIQNIKDLKGKVQYYYFKDKR